MRLCGYSRAFAAALTIVALAACSFSPKPETQGSATSGAGAGTAAASALPADLGGRWRLTAAAGGACFIGLGGAPGALQGTVAPENGCPANFVKSRKWAYERGLLIVRDFKGAELARLSFAGGHFEGKDKTGGSVMLSR